MFGVSGIMIGISMVNISMIDITTIGIIMKIKIGLLK